jgi:transposase
MQNIKNYVGIDIAKSDFDVAIETGGHYRHYKFSNDVAGFKTLVQQLTADSHAVMEASGPYYLKLACYLHEQGIAVSVVNPLVIRRFCQMRLSRTKTDKKDAKMIAEYGKTEHPSNWKPDMDYVMELRQLQATSDLLNKNRTSLLRQHEAFSQLTVISKEAVKAIRQTVKHIEKQIVILELKMQSLIKQYHGKMYAQIQTIPGLGKKTSLLLIVISGGFTKFTDARQISSYIGICPRIFESGTSVKGRARITKMGMSRIRAMLYLCAWSAKKCNQTCKELYERLVANGKSKRLALIAVANKLIKQAFAIATNNTTYQPNYQKNICF